MSFLRGLATAVGEKDQRDHESQQLEEKIQAERKNMLFSLAQKRGGSTGGSSSGGGASGSVSQMRANAKMLIKEGFSQDMVENLLATQNPEAIQTVVDTYQEQKETFQQTNGSIGMPPAYFKKFAEDTVIELASEGKYDMKDLQERFRIQLNPEELKVMENQSWVVPGAVSVIKNVDFKPLSQSELASFKANLGSDLIDEMNRQKFELQEVLTGLNERAKTKDIGDVGRQLRDFATSRLTQLESAEENYKNSKAPTYLIEALGTAEFAQKYFEYDKRLTKTPTFKSLNEVADRAAVDIPNLKMVDFLAANEREIIRPGSLFTHQGKTVVYVPSRQWLNQNSASLPQKASIYLDGKIHSLRDFM